MGRIEFDANDPVFNELQVWVDANGDGVSQTTELRHLAQQHITAINYAQNTFTRAVNGTGAGVGNAAGTVTRTTSLLASPDLAAERDGTQQTLIADGLLIQSSNGTLSLIVNNVQDLSGGAARMCRKSSQRNLRGVREFTQCRWLEKRSGSGYWNAIGWRIAIGTGFHGDKK